MAIYFSLVLLATTTVLLASHTHGHSSLLSGKHDLCEKADFKPLCRTMVKGLADPRAALGSAIYQLIFQSRRAMRLVNMHGKSEYVDVCKENLDDAIDNLNTCLQNLKENDLASLNTNLSAALADYVTCDDSFSESGQSNPFGQIDELLRDMASNCLYLSTLLHWGSVRPQIKWPSRKIL